MPNQQHPQQILPPNATATLPSAEEKLSADACNALLGIAEKLAEPEITREMLADVMRRACALTGDAGAELGAQTHGAMEAICGWFEGPRDDLRARTKLPLRREGNVVGMATFYSGAAPRDTHTRTATMRRLESLLARGVVRFVRGEEPQADGGLRQADLEAARHRLEHLLTANPAIIYTRSAGAAHELTFISDDVRSRFGYEPADFLRDAEFWIRHVHPEDAARVMLEVSADASVGNQSIEYRFLHADGRYRWIHDEYKLVALNGVAELIGCWVDISELKETEFMLARQTRRLAKSNRELEQFAYVASHDLRAPLRALDTLSEWLETDLDPVLTPESRQQMSLLRGRVRRMDHLLADLLEYSRVGRINIALEEVETAELVREIVDLSQLDHILDVRLDGPMPKFTTARLPLKRVFMNLLTNAAKHHDRPHGTVQVRCVDNGDHFSFSVADDGPGIPVEYHERVFQMFQTLKPRDTTEGSGMGLALVRRIVESAGGRLTLESGKGRGAIFRFTWPRAWQDISPASSSFPVLPVAEEFGARP